MRPDMVDQLRRLERERISDLRGRTLILLEEAEELLATEAVHRYERAAVGSDERRLAAERLHRLDLRRRRREAARAAPWSGGVKAVR